MDYINNTITEKKILTIDKKFEPIYEMLRGSVIRGIVFSVYDKFGPQNIYSFPPPIEQNVDGFGLSREERIQEKIDKYRRLIESEIDTDEEIFNTDEYNESNFQDSSKGIIQEFTQRDLMQIAIKSLSLLIGEEETKKFPFYFGVLPYPDFDVCAYTYFNFYSKDEMDEPKVCTFSLLIDNNRRRFIYDNIHFLKSVIKEAADMLTSFLQEAGFTVEGVDDHTLGLIHSVVFDFFSKLKLAENRPFTPITTKKQLKVALVGLKNSGKTSFLLTINRKYSEFDRKKPQGLSSTQFADLMGITVVKWDVGEWERSKPRFLTDANIYLYDTNLIYYFIDATSPNSLDENIQWFSRIVQYLREFSINIPIILIISQVDLDVAEKPEIREVITLIRSKISAIALKYMKNFNFFETSIFDLTSVLRAFSYGITVLNPNKEISDKILQKYSKILNSSAIMIFNENGLILGEHSIDPNFDMKHDYPLKFVLETIVPECIDIIKNQKRHEFSQKSLNSRLITKLNDGKAIFMEKFEISDFKMFLIIYTDIKELNEEFNKNLKNLVLEFTEIYKMFIF